MSRLWRFDVRLVRVLSRLGGDLSASDCQSRGNEYGATDSVTGKEVVSVNVRYARAGRRASDPSAGYAPCPERAGLATVIQGTDGRVLLAVEVRRVSGLTTPVRREFGNHLVSNRPTAPSHPPAIQCTAAAATNHRQRWTVNKTVDLHRFPARVPTDNTTRHLHQCPKVCPNVVPKRADDRQRYKALFMLDLESTRRVQAELPFLATVLSASV
jgi:hypothetical protein